MNKRKNPHLSIVIPVYNEEKRIKNIATVISYLKKKKYSWEVIIVDDGSTDKTGKILQSQRNKYHFKLISYSTNVGKGYAIKMGMLTANGKYKLFMDIDLSTPMEEIDNFLPLLKKFDIVIGSRKMKSSKVMIRQSIIREFLGKMFTSISQRILQMNISDFTCGFKCFNKDIADIIFSRQTINRWGFDSEILYIGKNNKHSIKEVPVSWANDPRTRVKFPQDIVNSLNELIKIRLNSLFGLYR